MLWRAVRVYSDRPLEYPGVLVARIGRLIQMRFAQDAVRGMETVVPAGSVLRHCCQCHAPWLTYIRPSDIKVIDKKEGGLEETTRDARPQQPGRTRSGGREPSPGSGARSRRHLCTPYGQQVTGRCMAQALAAIERMSCSRC